MTDDYLAKLPEDQRKALQHLREIIQAAAPDAVEGLSYGMPAFRLGKRPLVAFGAAKSHCALYPMSPAVQAAHETDLQNFNQSKGTIRFQPDSPLPDHVVRSLVEARLRELKG